MIVLNKNNLRTMNLVIITWVSWSGKTTIQDAMLKQWWARPINFTTRNPRTNNALEIDDEWDYNSKELWEYIFITEDVFFKKLSNWDFIEHTNYNGNWYWISRCFPNNENVCLVLDPIGREQVLEKLSREFEDINLVCVYLDIPRETQEQRLKVRWDSQEEIDKRIEDFNWFCPFWPWARTKYKWLLLDGETPVEENIKTILCETLKKT